MMNIRKIIKTAPDTKSDKVLELERSGKIGLIVEAVRNERKNEKFGAGARGSVRDSGSAITVKRVGAYSK